MTCRGQESSQDASLLRPHLLSFVPPKPSASFCPGKQLLSLLRTTSAEPALLPPPARTYWKAQNMESSCSCRHKFQALGPSNSLSIENCLPGISFKLIGSGTAHQLNAGPRLQEHLCHPSFPPHCSSNGLGTGGERHSICMWSSSLVTERPHHRDLLRLKGVIMTNTLFPKLRVGRGKSAVWHIAKIAL